jgi:hypothetical protein
MQRDGVQGWGLAIRAGGAALLCALALALLLRAMFAPPSSPGDSVAAKAEAKALEFLEDTNLSEADRRATARDIAALCKEGRIKGC